ncbi:unnamed protein product [Lactuca virosa]|uniref:Uncharacterized protein n=1 Tax=Lactuca virosa TaxID=75947 RepID=A0AAU9P565_9ASTR|nr:unnamed protein product [Lactuca virosa]
MEMDYEFGEFDEVAGEGRDTNEVPSEPPTSETVQYHSTVPRDLVDRTHSLEEEVATLRQQLLATEARAVQAEHERDEKDASKTKPWKQHNTDSTRNKLSCIPSSSVRCGHCSTCIDSQRKPRIRQRAGNRKHKSGNKPRKPQEPAPTKTSPTPSLEPSMEREA